jgi:polyribonucleotide nucleotidyltransferase
VSGAKSRLRVSIDSEGKSELISWQHPPTVEAFAVHFEFMPVSEHEAIVAELRAELSREHGRLENAKRRLGEWQD